MTHGARGRTVLRRLLPPGTGRRAETKPQLPRLDGHTRSTRSTTTVNVDPAQSVKDIEAGTADVTGDSRPTRPRPRASTPATAPTAPPPAPATNATSPTRHSVSRYLALNTSRPLFKNANLRRAVNYALNRQAITQAAGQIRARPRPADRPVPAAGHARLPRHPRLPEHPRPRPRQTTRPRPRRHTPSSTPAPCPFCHQLAQLVKAELAPIGISVETKYFQPGSQRAVTATRGAPFDIACAAATPRTTPTPPTSSPSSSTAARSTPPTTSTSATSTTRPTTQTRRRGQTHRHPRYRAYQALDAYLTRTAAPGVPLFDGTDPNFFSARIAADCKIHQPDLRSRPRRALPQIASPASANTNNSRTAKR